MLKTLRESIDFDKYETCSAADLKAEVRNASLDRDKRILHLDLTMNFLMTAEEIELFRSRLLKKLTGIHQLEVTVDPVNPVNGAEINRKREAVKAARAQSDSQEASGAFPGGGMHPKGNGGGRRWKKKFVPVV